MLCKAENRDPARTTLADAMTRKPDTIGPRAKAIEALRLMQDCGIRHLPVAGPDGLVGVITSGDVLAFESDEQRTTIEHLESYVYHNR